MKKNHENPNLYNGSRQPIGSYGLRFEWRVERTARERPSLLCLLSRAARALLSRDPKSNGFLAMTTSCARDIVTFDICLHEVCVRVGGRLYATYHILM